MARGCSAPGRAVFEPAGIEHLEDPEVLDRLAAASGELARRARGRAVGARQRARRPAQRTLRLHRARHVPLVGRADLSPAGR